MMLQPIGTLLFFAAVYCSASPEPRGASEKESPAADPEIVALRQQARQADVRNREKIRGKCVRQRLSLIKKLNVIGQKLEDSLQAAAVLDKLEISKLEPARYDSSTWGVGFTVTNHNAHTITCLELEATLTTPGRKIPWAKDRIEWKLAGGLNPGETRSCLLLPGKEKRIVCAESGDTLVGALSARWSRLGDSHDRLHMRILTACGEDIFPPPGTERESSWDFTPEEVINEYRENIVQMEKSVEVLDRLIAELSSPSSDAQNGGARSE